jgi:hypothetical protein
VSERAGFGAEREKWKFDIEKANEREKEITLVIRDEIVC